MFQKNIPQVKIINERPWHDTRVPIDRTGVQGWERAGHGKETRQEGATVIKRWINSALENN